MEYRIARKKSVVEAQGVTKQYLWKCIKDSNLKKVLRLSGVIKNVARADIQLILLPVHRPELSPIELLWAQVKHHVRANNVEQTQSRAEFLVREKVALLGQEAWESVQRHVLKVEKKYREIQTLEEENHVECGVSDCEVENDDD